MVSQPNVECKDLGDLTGGDETILIAFFHKFSVKFGPSNVNLDIDIGAM